MLKLVCVLALAYAVSGKSIVKREYESASYGASAPSYGGSSYGAASASYGASAPSYGGSSYGAAASNYGGSSYGSYEKQPLVSNYNPCTQYNNQQYGSYEYGPEYHPADSSYGASWFIECNWNIPYLLECPAGLVWKQELLTCDWPESYYGGSYNSYNSYNLKAQPSYGSSSYSAPAQSYGSSSYSAPAQSYGYQAKGNYHAKSYGPSYAAKPASYGSSYSAPSYQAQSYSAPSYKAASSYSAPSYQAQSYSAPSYSASSSY